MMKKYLKKGLAGILTLVMALSAMTCLAAAADDSGTPEITLYITCDQDEIRPGHDALIDVKYTMGPVKNLRSLRCVVSEVEGLAFDYITNNAATSDHMFGIGESLASGRTVFAYAYPDDLGGHAFSSDEDFYLFSARYGVPEVVDEEEVTFGLDSFSFVTEAGAAVVNIVTEPVRIVNVDTATLERRVSVAENYLSESDRFSDHSVAALEEALADANEVLENIENYYQEDVDEALNALNAAIENLKSPAEEVEAAIEAAGELRESEYTTDSWGNLTDALEAAKEIRDKTDATDEDLNGAADALYEAIDALVPVDDPVTASRKALEKAVETVKGLNQDDYPESAWAALQTALEDAEQVLSDENATKEELDEAYDALALALARANLEKDVDYAKQLSSSNYTSDSWEALQTAIADAEEILNNEDATQAELEDADDALIAALNGLVAGGTGSGTTYPGGTGTSGGTTTSGVKSPQTGDSDFLLMSMIVLAAGMGTCGMVCGLKARGRKE